MKKVFLALGLMTVYAANAQDNDGYKPVQGNVVTELGLTGGLGNTAVNLNQGGTLKGRYFYKNQTAFRLGVNITSESDKQNFYENATSSNKGVRTEKGTGVLLNLGIEKHFNGTERLSPYVGGDLLLGFGNSKNSNDKTDGTSYVQDLRSEVKTSSFAFGLRGVIGADYYFAKNVFLGVEAGLGFLSEKEGATKGSTTVGGQTTSFETKSPGSSFELSPTVVTGIRVGFVF